MKTFLAFLLFAFSAHADTLDDDQIINIMMTVDNGEISTANEVLKRNLSSKVHQYAVYLIQEHQANLDQLNELARKLKLDPKTSDISASLVKGGDKDLKNIQDQEGLSYDKAYVDAMVKEHQGGLEAIDSKLIPQAKNAQLKAFLYKFRSMVYNHLQRGLELQKSLNN